MKPAITILALLITALVMRAATKPPASPSAAGQAITPASLNDQPDANTVAETALNPPVTVSSIGEANALADSPARATESGLEVSRQSRGSTGAPANYTLAEQMLAEHDRIRGLNKLCPLTLDPSLCRAAQDYADHLARTRQQGHYADGTPEQRAARAGFTGSIDMPKQFVSKGVYRCGQGEVLAFGHPSIEAAFQGWMESDGHRAALMEPTFDVCGFGRNGNVFVGVLGNTKAEPPKVQSVPVQSYYVAPHQSTRYYTHPRRGLFGRRW